MKKRAQRAAKKQQKLNSDVMKQAEDKIDKAKRKGKSSYNRLRRNFDRKVDTLKINVEILTGKLQESTESTNQAADDTNDSLNHTPPAMPLPTESTPLAKRIWKTLTPPTKSKVCKSLSVAGPSGLSKQYREQIGLNLSKIETVKKKLRVHFVFQLKNFSIALM